MNTFLNVTLIGESYDEPCNPTRSNTIIKSKQNGFKTVNDITWDDWELAIVFPDEEKAIYFQKNFNRYEMKDFREGMLKDDYIFHVIHFKYPKVEKLYADQIKMEKNYKKEY